MSMQSMQGVTIPRFLSGLQLLLKKILEKFEDRGVSSENGGN